MSEAAPEHDAEIELPEAEIAGFWRRLAAFVVDSFIVGGPLFFVGHVYFEWASGLGESGRLIGFLWALAYFGVLNSKIGRGQTLGKRLLGVQVVGRSGDPISLPFSLVRFAVLGGPWCLNGIWVDIDIRDIGFAEILAGIVLVVILFGGMGALVYLYVFNRQTRQALHDLVVGSFVVRSQQVAQPVGRVTPRLHLVVVGCWFAVCFVMSGITAYVVTNSDAAAALAELKPVRQDLKKEFGALSVKIQLGTHAETRGEAVTRTTVMQVTVKIPESRKTLPSMASDIAYAVLQRHPDLLGRQVLAIRIVRGFNFGFASWSKAGSAVYPLADWRKQLGL